MITEERTLQLQEQLENYNQEVLTIRNKLGGDTTIPLGKKARISFRLHDLEVRLIPNLQKKIQRIDDGSFTDSLL